MELSENITHLELSGRHYYVIGTAHVSRESVDEVSRLIEQVHPDTVCVELCDARYQALTDRERWKKLDIFQVIRQGKTLFLLANLAVGAYQRRLGAQLGVQPGAELLQAVHKARECGAELRLIDRDIHVTLKRAWGNVSFWKKMNLLAAILESLIGGDELKETDLEELKKQSNLSEMMREFAEAFPDVKATLIDERDAYLTSRMREATGEKVVVVVGAGHVPGMVRLFEEPIDRTPLERIPPPGVFMNLLKWVIPALVMAAFVFGYYKYDGATFQQMLLAWFLPTSILAALWTIFAGARPLTILSAGLSSPLTTLNPLISAGMVAGLVEAWLRRPTVEDAERINDDVQSLKGFYKNPFTRVLLVFFLSSVGASLGAWVGGAWIIALLS